MRKPNSKPALSPAPDRAEPQPDTNNVRRLKTSHLELVSRSPKQEGLSLSKTGKIYISALQEFKVNPAFNEKHLSLVN